MPACMLPTTEPSSQPNIKQQHKIDSSFDIQHVYLALDLAVCLSVIQPDCLQTFSFCLYLVGETATKTTREETTKPMCFFVFISISIMFWNAVCRRV